MAMNFTKTYRSPINNSGSKQLYSFPKSQRFQPSRRSQCKNSFYQTKTGAFQKRAASFGYGYKMSFENKEGVPFPGKYTKDNQFSLNKIKKRGYSFGKNQNRNILDNPQQLRRLPGPGAYVSQNQKFKTGLGTGFENIKFSMRGKYEDPLSKHGNTLGPGEYPSHGQTNKTGNFFNSKYPNSGCKKVDKTDRFPYQKPEVPGPGKYYDNEKVGLNKTGVYYASNFKTNTVNAFPLTSRPSPAKKNESPGPGTYHDFTQFSLQNKSWNPQF